MMKMKDYIKQQLINYASENIDSKYIRYLNKYITLINSLLINQQIDEIITEAHHIVPRSWNPDLIYDENNIICVSVKAHLILHHMLALTRDTRMCRAFYSMINMKPKDVFNYAVHVNLAAQAKQMWYDISVRPVVNLNTGEVFESIKDAQLSLQRNLNIAGAISKRCRCGGYHWQYKDVVEQTSIEEQLNQYELHKITAKENRKRIKSQIGCKVKCVETGEIFATMTQAAKHFNTTCNCISRHTNRGTCTQAGYHFVLYEDKHS